MTLKKNLIIGILAMGALALGLVLLSNSLNRSYAYQHQRDTLTELVGLKVAEVLAKTDIESRHLGNALQQHSGFKQSFVSGDINALGAVLNSTIDPLSDRVSTKALSKVYFLDKNYGEIARYSVVVNSSQNNQLHMFPEFSQLCADTIKRAREYQSTQPSMVLGERCQYQQRAYYSLLWPINSSQAEGFIQIIIDLTTVIKSLEETLGMPFMIFHPDSEIEAYRSELWPSQVDKDLYIESDYVLREPSGKTILTLRLVHDVSMLDHHLKRAEYIMLVVTSVLIILLITIALYKLKGSLRPLESIVHAARQLRQGNYQRINETSFPEINNLVESFNDNAEFISRLIHELEAEIKVRIEVEKELLNNRQELETARDQAFASSNAKSAFLANMSHELRTPLNAILGYSDILLEQAKEEGQDQNVEDLRKISLAGEHLLNLINEILDLSKIEANKIDLHLDEISVDELIHTLADTARPLVEERSNTLVVKGAGECGNMLADRTRLYQVLLNIIGNACKFTENGTITIAAECYMCQNVRWISFEVTDTGIGIKEESLPRIFSAFDQADASTAYNYGGTGLGLVISQRFCELMGGYITASSVEHEGSTFTVRLPMSVQNSQDNTQEEMSEISQRIVGVKIASN